MLRGANKGENVFESPSISPDCGKSGALPPHAGISWLLRKRRGQQRSSGMRGFTLLEMMIVISIILILMAVALPIYNQSILRSREAVLRQNLFTLRSVISQYTLDKQKAPQSLEDVVQAGYLRQIPNDPMTGQPNWEVVQEDVLLAVDQQDPGISDVHSASNLTASDGTAYSSW
jgi:general secretion pathway protein G